MQTAITDPESREVICGNCGMVIAESLDLVNAQRDVFTVEESEKSERTGTPTSLTRHDKGLATVLGEPIRDAGGRILDSNTRSTSRR
jgi:transcription initiation factor TFIIB